MAANTLATATLLEECSKAGVRKLVFSSSSAIYGDDPAQPKDESMTPRPISPYGLSKLDGEILCGIFSKSGRLKTACLRYFNVFGPRQDVGSAYAAAIPIFICKALKDEDIPVYGDGSQTRDFVFVKEIAAANAFMAKSDFEGVCNVGYGKTVEIGALAKRIVAELGSKSKIVIYRNAPETSSIPARGPTSFSPQATPTPPASTKA
jgi:UDP-glucose 4-epimerase